MGYLKNVLLVFLVFLAVSFMPYHHGWSNYDQEKVLDYKGIILEVSFENPHATAKLKVGDKIWLTILAPNSRMESRGVPKDKLKKGLPLRVIGYPHKEIKDEMRIERIFIDEEKYELR